MDAQDVYNRLNSTRDVSACDPFDVHVLACILALGFAEAQAEGQPVVEAVGLSRAELARVMDEFFPHAKDLFVRAEETVPTRGADEDTLIDMLVNCSTTGSSFEALMARMLARRAQRPNHLWQDLGLRNRTELSQLMNKYFAPIAVRNTKDMKWKKYLYRTICRDAGYSLCVAPSCSECNDFDNCFGEESGESLLARIRRDMELTAN